MPFISCLALLARPKPVSAPATEVSPWNDALDVWLAGHEAELAASLAETSDSHATLAAGISSAKGTDGAPDDFSPIRRGGHALRRDALLQFQAATNRNATTKSK